MKVIFSERQREHNPESYLSSGAAVPNPELPERADRLLAAALSAGLEPEAPADYGDDLIASIHAERYLTFLENIHTRWSRIEGASKEVLPNVHPIERSDGYPKSAVGQVGFHVYDASCPIAAHTWLSARWSAMTAAHAAQRVISGDSACYALSRPPGHHASQDLAGGFCYLNNSAIAAQHLLSKFARVAIIDVDVHHGNGTQRIFYERDDVLTVSIHADPIRFYPFFWGYANETGSGAGLGYNVNIPLVRGTGDEDYLRSLDKALTAVGDYAPEAIVIALGLDAHEEDPYQGMKITTPGFARIASRLAALALPSVIVQEGGYLSDALGPNLASFLNGFQ
ncbi:MAG: histone deacetylase family protein [Gammaproteobacteria bacterium]|nr:histone deacetylase family protein [Gammaproteobacteria bacterium]MDH5240056.1 histone deacetylase family protein [Gammaproteobacteria bacterium]MDH5262165.1 histone deacetylase family protein [Gammaproteobacteria bacterium]MDH5582415.1 histone deacetylase family protein [Gammaproteobacteria bacterium]